MPFAVPKQYLTLAPVIVTSPTARCGTTLVQRLLSASDNAFLYGEDVGNHLSTLAGSLIGMSNQFDANGRAFDEDYRRALAGTLADWRPSVLPPTDVLLRAWIEIFYQIPRTLAEHGRAIGRPIWGLKHPSFPRDVVKAFLLLMPGMRVIYVVRDLASVLKSAKARRFVVGDEAVARFCADWAKNVAEMMELRQDPRVRFLAYERLVADRDAQTSELERFTGVRGIRREVFDLKVNTFVGDPMDGRSPTQYIEPAELTDADRAAMAAHAGPLLAKLYPALPA